MTMENDMKTTLSMLALALTATPALAQTSGPRVELTTGYDVLTSGDALEGAADDIPDTLGGLRVGATFGYDLAVSPRVTIGAEVGVGTTVTGTARSSFAGDTLELRDGRDLDVSARLGWIAAPRTVLFVKAGYANSRATAVLREKVGTGFETTRYGGNGSGLRLGGGVEHGIGRGLYVKAEYRWTRYGREEIEYQSRTQRHQLLAGIGTRF